MESMHWLNELMNLASNDLGVWGGREGAGVRGGGGKGGKPHLYIKYQWRECVGDVLTTYSWRHAYLVPAQGVDRSVWTFSHVWRQKWVSEWVGEWANEWVSGWVRGWVSEWVSGWESEWVSGWVSQPMCEWVGEWVSGWVGEWVSGWVGGWVSEWVNEWVL